MSENKFQNTESTYLPFLYEYIQPFIQASTDEHIIEQVTSKSKYGIFREVSSIAEW